MKNRGRDISKGKRILHSSFFILHLSLLLAIPTTAFSATIPLPSLQIGLGQADNPGQVSILLQVVA
ncbi:MAG: hypothetical protein KAU38_08915, partial [Desulfobacterales bacterium]|nr:hypothetical protein [Desulfobacterales bacterium]